MTVAERLAEHVAHFRARVLQDALQEATTAYWLRRADTFTAVGTPACDLIATNCRNHATLIRRGWIGALNETEARKVIEEAR